MLHFKMSACVLYIFIRIVLVVYIVLLVFALYFQFPRVLQFYLPKYILSLYANLSQFFELALQLKLCKNVSFVMAKIPFFGLNGKEI